MNKYRLLCFLFASLCSAACVAAASPVLVISVDGLHPAYVTQADRHGLKIPVLRRLLKEGAHASGVVGVVPTVTYPSEGSRWRAVEVAGRRAPQRHCPGAGQGCATGHGRVSGADFLVEFAPGFYFGNEVRGEMLRPGVSKGTHGYLPSRPEMHASLFIRGPNIEAGRDLGVIDMRQIAPTFAAMLRVRLPHKTEPALKLSGRGSE